MTNCCPSHDYKETTERNTIFPDWRKGLDIFPSKYFRNVRLLLLYQYIVPRRCNFVDLERLIIKIRSSHWVAAAITC